MSKLWAKGYELDKVVEAFTVGEDPILDRQLIRWDALGSMAHARMLAAIGILTSAETTALCRELARVVDLDSRGEFHIPAELEDVHTAVENHLIRELGDLGKKVHTARSRNDQVILDLRMYMRDRISAIGHALFEIVHVLVDFAETHQDVPIPGRTHFQLAMPSSVGLWAGAFAESLLDDWKLFETTVEIVDQCPLGSAASYGVNLEIDRPLVAELLGFRQVQNNVLYVNNSRGKVEAILLSACTQVMNDLSKLSTDVILWSMPEFRYFSLPPEFCPGSSLMPQKRNPGPFELTRAKAATVQACLHEVLEITRPLISGYNRDFQVTKGPMMRGLSTTLASLRVNRVCMEKLGVNREACIQAFRPELFATDRVLEMAREGIPFRDAYRKVAASLDEMEMEDPVENIRGKVHVGATGNLGLGLARDRLELFSGALTALEERWESALSRLLSEASGTSHPGE